MNAIEAGCDEKVTRVVVACIYFPPSMLNSNTVIRMINKRPLTPKSSLLQPAAFIIIVVVVVVVIIIILAIDEFNQLYRRQRLRAGLRVGLKLLIYCF